MSRSNPPVDPPFGPSSDPSAGPAFGSSPGSSSGGPHDAPRGPSAGASRFQRMRMRRGAPPQDAVLRMEHFHVTAAEKRRREAMERSRGRLVITAGLFAALFTVVCFRVAWVTVIHPVHANYRA